MTSSNNISFESAISRPPSFTFTPPPYEDRTSSNETSLLDDDDVLHIERSLKQEPSGNPPVPSFSKQSDTKIIRELVNNGPCRPLSSSDELPRHISFLVRYECHRVARRASMSPRQFFKEVSKSCKSEHLDTLHSGMLPMLSARVPNHLRNFWPLKSHRQLLGIAQRAILRVTQTSRSCWAVP